MSPPEQVRAVKLIESILIALFAIAVAGIAPAQGGKQIKVEQVRIPIPEKLERATAKDEAGVTRWSKYDAKRCVNCNGKKTMQCQHCLRIDKHEDCPECHNKRVSVCRVCAGTGEMADILEQAPCPSCFGASMTACFICGGRGGMSVEGAGKRLTKCGCCKSVGAFKCATCKGKRFVETPKLRPSVGQAKLKDLNKALAALVKVQTELAKFTTKRDGRKDMKEYAKVVKAGGKYLPPLRRAQKHFEVVSKAQSKGAVWQQYADRVELHTDAMKKTLDYYLEHQKRVLELCIARAEANAEVGGK